MSIKTILRTVIASGLVVGTAAALSPAAFAATDNDTQSSSITAIETVNYVAGPSLTIAPNTLQADQDFGSVQVQSNSNAGWTLAVASTNGSFLQNTTVSAAQIPYSLKVDGTAVNVSTAATNVNTSLNPTTLTAAAGSGNNYLVKGSIAATDSNGKPAGTYTDTLTFTLTNK